MNHTHGIVARIGDDVITEAELERRLTDIRRGPFGPRLPEDGTPAGVRLRRWVAQLLASEALVVHESRRLVHRQSAREPAPADSGRAPEQAVRALFGHVTAAVTVPETEVRRYYRANPDLWTRPEHRTVRQAVRATRAEAARARAEDLAAPETLTRGQLTGPFEDAVFTASPGEWIGPVRTGFGWHRAVLDRIDPAGTDPYEAVRETIHFDLLTAARGTAFDDWLALRRCEVVHLASGYEHPGDPSLPDAVHRH